MGQVDGKIETQRKNEKEMLKKFCSRNEECLQWVYRETWNSWEMDPGIETSYTEMQREKEIKFF